MKMYSEDALSTTLTIHCYKHYWRTLEPSECYMLCIFKLSTLKDKNWSIEYSENDERKRPALKNNLLQIMKGRELKEASGSLLPSFSLVGGK